MTITMPALSEDGWVMTDQLTADYIFSHFFLTDYSQTYLYKDQVSSFAYLLANSVGNPTKLQSDVQGQLQSYFSRYFNNVAVDCSSKQNSQNPNEYTLTIYVSFDGKDGKNYTLGKLAFISGSISKKVIDLNNYGT